MKNLKKIGAMLLAIVMVVGMVPMMAFAADAPCEHVAAEAVKENVVEATWGEAGSHDEVVYCTLCNAEMNRETKEDPALGADWEAEFAWGENGTIPEVKLVYKGEGEKVDDIVLDDVKVSAPIFEDATCSHGASMTATATATYYVDNVPYEYTDTHVWDLGGQLEHNFGEWKILKPATCTEDGTKSRECQNEGCNVIDVQFVKGEHKYEAVETAPTCTKDGFTTYTCSVCDDSYVVAGEKAAGHKFGEWKVTKEPTCGKEGEKEHTCEVCGEKETEVIKATGEHVAKKEWKYDTENHWHICKECGEKVEVAKHTFNSEDVCTECEYDKNNPPTGDETSMILWIGISVIAMSAMAMLMMPKKKAHKAN